MKETKKLNNLVIRQNSKRSSRQESAKLKPILPLNQDIKRVTQTKLDSNFELQKQFIKAENLTEEQQLKIRKQAQKTANKKMRGTQIKIQNEMINMLETECSKLGAQVEKQKAQNQKLRFQMGEMRKNIEYLSTKLEDIFKDKQNLAKNNDYNQMQKGQLRQQLRKINILTHKLQQQKNYLQISLNSQIKILKTQNEDKKNQIKSMEARLKQIIQERQQIQQQLQQKNKECEYIRQNFEQRKRQWDRIKQDLESNTKDNLQKKGYKITQYQAQMQSLNDRLKEEEILRKKLTDKNQQLQREVLRKQQSIKQLEEQIGGLKKRVNDLSILKSSNNTIMNQKLQQLNDENTKLKKDIENLQTKKKIFVQQQSSKPFLFGPEEKD